MSFSVSTSVQLLRSCNSYLRTTKRKNTLKNCQIRKLRGARVSEGGAESKRNTETIALLWKIAFPLFLFPRLPSPTSIFASLALVFASLANFCILFRLERENREAVNCQLLLWHLPGELLTGNRTYLSFALQVLFAKGPNFIQRL